MRSPDKLKAALERLVAGTATMEDRQALQRALLNGTIIFATGDRAATVGRDVQRAIIITGDNNYVSFESKATKDEQLRQRLFPGRPGIAPPLPSLIFVGRENALQNVKEQLGITETAVSRHDFIVIRGWPGVGKTTLVAALAYDPDVADSLSDGVLWTALGQTPNLLSEMSTWGRALGTDALLRAPTLKEATEQLASLLHNKRMLLIVDDVWKAEHAVPFQQARGLECALVFTTRLPQVATELTPAPDAIYPLPVLTEENALKLLRILAPTVVQQYPSECLELVRDLENLPLALHVAGRLLNREASFGWGVTELVNELREGAKLINAKAPADRIDLEKQTIPTVAALLKKSTDLLDSHTRDCFAFLGAFAPKPATFDLAAMMAVWQVDDPRPIARVLVDHGLLEPVESSRFQMHALLVSHARSFLTE